MSEGGRSLFILAGFAALLSAPGVVLGHHSFSAEFSRDLPIEVVGTVTSIDWRNPHARFYVDVEDENGNVVNWNFELRSPNILMRHGWNKDSVKPGDVVSVTGFRARNDPHVGRASTVVVNGQPVFTTDSDTTDSDSE